MKNSPSGDIKSAIGEASKQASAVNLFALLPSENSPLITIFSGTFPALKTRTIKQLFRSYTDAFTGEELVTKLLADGRVNTRDEGEKKGQQMLDAYLLFNYGGAKEPFKDKEKCILTLSLKGKILIYGEKFLEKSVEDVTSGDNENVPQITVSQQFCIFRTAQLKSDDNLMDFLLSRMVFSPDLLLSEYSEHVLSQGLTGTCLTVRDRQIKTTKKFVRGTFHGCDAVEWIMFNTDVESREQALILGEIFLRQNKVKPFNSSNAVAEGFFDDKDHIYFLRALEPDAVGEVASDTSSQVNASGASSHSVSALSESGGENLKSNSNLDSVSSRRAILNQILEDSKYYRAFENYLTSIYCTENLHFWSIVRIYKNSFKLVPAGPDNPEESYVPETPEYTASIGLQIYEKYIKGEGLNVDHNMKKLVESEVTKKNFHYKLYDAIRTIPPES